MRIGIHFMNFTIDARGRDLAPTLAATAETAEQIGCAWFTMMDHWFQMEQFATSHDPMLEGYTSLGFVAGRTKSIKLGLLVTGVTYRHPGLLAKIVTTLDVLSQGRAILGLGAAWYEREHLALGVTFPPISERFERLEETLQICQQMWSANEGAYDGKYYHLAETINQPPAIQSPRPPIMIGGSGEKKTLRLVAKYADACNLFSIGPDAVKEKLDILRAHCDTEGTDYDAIEKTMIARADPIGDPDGFLRAMEAYAAVGIEHIQMAPQGPDPLGWVEKLAPVVPRLAAIG